MRIPRLTARDDNKVPARDDNKVPPRDDNKMPALDDRRALFPSPVPSRQPPVARPQSIRPSPILLTRATAPYLRGASPETPPDEQ